MSKVMLVVALKVAVMTGLTTNVDLVNIAVTAEIVTQNRAQRSAVECIGPYQSSPLWR